MRLQYIVCALMHHSNVHDHIDMLTTLTTVLVAMALSLTSHIPLTFCQIWLEEHSDCAPCLPEMQ